MSTPISAPQRSAGAALRVVPGVMTAGAVAAAAIPAAEYLGTRVLGFEDSPVSAVMVALLLGMVLGNIRELPNILQPGLAFSMKRVLRIGVVLLGIRISVGEVLRVGAVALPLVTVCVVGALVIVRILSDRFGVAPKLGTLIAVGTSICGVSAIVAAAPTIDAAEEDTSYAISTITIFGLIALLLYPFLAHSVFGGMHTAIGYFLGTAVHDTSQVTGAALLYSELYAAPAVIDVATVTKLLRNSLMALVIPVIAIQHRERGIPDDVDTRAANGAGGADEARGGGATAGGGDVAHNDLGNPGAARRAMRAHVVQGTRETKVIWPPGWAEVARYIPLFVVGFVLMSVLRTLGDISVWRFERAFWIVSPEHWNAAVAAVSQTAVYALVVALAAVGARTRLRRLLTLGAKPFFVGLAAAATVGVLSTGLIFAARTMIAGL